MSGQLLRKNREAKRLSGRAVASLTGISQATLSRLENDRRPPTEAEWHTLRQHLALPKAPPREMPLPSAATIWRVPAPRLSCTSPIGFSARAYRARESFGPIWKEQLALLESREDARLSWRFLNDSGSDSGPEAMFWVLLIATGARPCWYPPVKAGFRKFPIVDRSRKRRAAGDLRHPCLELRRDGYRLLLFPQVRVVTPQGLYVLDALVLFRRGRQREWLNLEIDGSGHDGERDVARQEHLGLLTLRVCAAELRRPGAFITLEQRLFDLCARPEKDVSI